MRDPAKRIPESEQPEPRTRPALLRESFATGQKRFQLLRPACFHFIFATDFRNIPDTMFTGPSAMLQNPPVLKQSSTETANDLRGRAPVRTSRLVIASWFAAGHGAGSESRDNFRINPEALIAGWMVVDPKPGWRITTWLQFESFMPGCNVTIPDLTAGIRCTWAWSSVRYVRSLGHFNSGPVPVSNGTDAGAATARSRLH